MNTLVHNITVKVFEKEEDNIESCVEVFHRLLPLNFKKEKIQIHHEKVEGFLQKIIHILSVKFEKKRHTTMVLDTIFSHFSSSEIDRIDGELVTRIDHHGFLFLRLDKQSLLDGIFKITESGDCFHFKIKLMAYPANDETYMETAKKIFLSYRKGA